MKPFFIEQSWRVALRMAGRDRIRFLHGMCTNDIRGLPPGQSSMAAVVSRQGKLVADIVVLNSTKTLILFADRRAAQTTIEYLTKFIVADDVTMTLVEEPVVGVYGAPAPSDLPCATDPALPIPGLLVLTPPSRLDEISRNLTRITEAEYERLRVENGFPRWGVDMGPDRLPMEAGLEPIAISYTKGCYIGQEVIQRVKTYSEPPQRLVQLEIADARPGDRIWSGGREIGQVTSVAPKVALGYVGKEFKAPGTPVAIGDRPAIVRALPWHARAGAP